MSADTALPDDAVTPEIEVYFSAYGELKRYFPQDRYSVTLPGGASLGDFYLVLERESVGELPAKVWLKEEVKFSSSVIVTVGGKITSDTSRILKHGQKIHAYRIIIGG